MPPAPPKSTWCAHISCSGPMQGRRRSAPVSRPSRQQEEKSQKPSIKQSTYIIQMYINSVNRHFSLTPGEKNYQTIRPQILPIGTLNPTRRGLRGNQRGALPEAEAKAKMSDASATAQSLHQRLDEGHAHSSGMRASMFAPFARMWRSHRKF